MNNSQATGGSAAITQLNQQFITTAQTSYDAFSCSYKVKGQREMCPVLLH